MSTLKVIQIQHPSAASAALTLDSSGNLSTSGSLTFPAGSASAPAIQATGDPNTGLFFPAADTIAFAEGGTEVLRIDSSGRLGLGTSTPQTTNGGLDVSSGGLGIIVGADSGASTRTDATTKLGRILAPHYTNAEEPVAGLVISNDSTENIVSVGGGTGLANAATVVRVFTAANSTTTTGTERLRVDSSGRVGIGTTSPGHALHVSNGNDSASGEFVGITIGGTNSGNARTGSIIKDTTTFDLIYRNQNFSSAVGAHVFRNGPSEHARIDSSGRLLVGTSSVTGIPATLNVIGGNNTVMHAQGANADSPFLFLSHARGTGTQSVNASDGVGAVAFVGYDGTNALTAARIEAFVDATPGANDMPGRLVFSTTADGASSPTERCRVNSIGNLIIGKTSETFGTAGAVIGPNAINDGNNWSISSTATAANSSGGNIAVNQGLSGAWALKVHYQGTDIGGVRLNGTTGTSFPTTSDYRLKENVVALENAGDRLKRLSVYRFNFISEPDRTVDGFIAHEVSPVVPEAICGEKDAVNDDGSIQPQGIDQSKLVPLLTAALQEALQKIDAMEARLAALEAS
jgi:hypothetical protein